MGTEGKVRTITPSPASPSSICPDTAGLAALTPTLSHTSMFSRPARFPTIFSPFSATNAQCHMLRVCSHRMKSCKKDGLTVAKKNLRKASCSTTNQNVRLVASASTPAKGKLSLQRPTKSPPPTVQRNFTPISACGVPPGTSQKKKQDPARIADNRLHRSGVTC